MIKFSLNFNNDRDNGFYITETTRLLRKMGIPPHISGYHYLREAIILVAGKGHEKYQDIKGVKHDFDDKEKVKTAFKELNL